MQLPVDILVLILRHTRDLKTIGRSARASRALRDAVKNQTHHKLLPPHLRAKENESNSVILGQQIANINKELKKGPKCPTINILSMTSKNALKLRPSLSVDSQIVLFLLLPFITSGKLTFKKETYHSGHRPGPKLTHKKLYIFQSMWKPGPSGISIGNHARLHFLRGIMHSLPLFELTIQLFKPETNSTAFHDQDDVLLAFIAEIPETHIKGVIVSPYMGRLSPPLHNALWEMMSRKPGLTVHLQSYYTQPKVALTEPTQTCGTALNNS